MTTHLTLTLMKLAEDLSRFGAGHAGDRGAIHTEKALRDPERSPVDKPVIPPRRPDEVSTQRHEQAILNDQRQIGQVESAPAGDGNDTESVLDDRAVLKNTMTHVTAPDGVDAKPQRNLGEIMSEILTGNRDNSPPQTHANRDVGSQNMDGNYQGGMPGNDAAEPEADGKTMTYIEPPTTKNTATPIPDQVPLSLTSPMQTQPFRRGYLQKSAESYVDPVNGYTYTPSLWNKSLPILETAPIQGLLQGINRYSAVAPANQWKNTAAGAAVGAAIALATTIGMKSREAEAVLETDPVTGKTIAKKKYVPANTRRIMRLLMGAGAGAAAGMFGPKLIQQTAGRVLSNIWAPVGYNPGSQLKLMRDQGVDAQGNFSKVRMISNLMKAVLKDKPIYRDTMYNAEGEKLVNATPLDKAYIGARSALMRASFGLPPHVMTNALSMRKDPESGQYEAVFNPETSEGKHLARSLRDSQREAESRLFAEVPDLMDKRLPDGRLQFRTDFGTIQMQPTGEFEYDWKYDVKPEEKITRISDVLRAMVSPFISPVKLRAKIPQDTDLDKGAALYGPVPTQRPGTLTPAVSAGERTEQRPSGAVTHLEPVATRPYSVQPLTQLAPPGYNKGTPSLNGGNAAPAIATDHGAGDTPVRTSDIKNPRLNLPGGAGRVASTLRRFSKSRIRGYIGGV